MGTKYNFLPETTINIGVSLLNLLKVKLDTYLKKVIK